MRSKVVKIANKEILVQEKRIKELKELSSKISVDVKELINTETDDKETNDIVKLFTDLVQDKLLIIFPQLDEEDLEDAYMSEIEELIQAFLEVNFMWAKKIGLQLMKFQ